MGKKLNKKLRVPNIIMKNTENHRISLKNPSNNENLKIQREN